MATTQDPFGSDALATAEQRMREKEEEIGITPLELLHAEIDKLKPRHQALAGRYADMRVWERKAKSLVLSYALEHRRLTRERGEKVTEAAVEAMAYADPRYIEFLEQSENDKAEYEWLTVEMQNLRERINRGQALLRAHAAERYAT